MDKQHLFRDFKPNKTSNLKKIVLKPRKIKFYIRIEAAVASPKTIAHMIAALATLIFPENLCTNPRIKIRIEWMYAFKAFYISHLITGKTT